MTLQGPQLQLHSTEDGAGGGHMNAWPAIWLGGCCPARAIASQPRTEEGLARPESWGWQSVRVGAGAGRGPELGCKKNQRSPQPELRPTNQDQVKQEEGA